jgi:glycerol-3-phosphate cytidylyltransferase
MQAWPLIWWASDSTTVWAAWPLRSVSVQGLRQPLGRDVVLDGLSVWWLDLACRIFTMAFDKPPQASPQHDLVAVTHGPAARLTPVIGLAVGVFDLLHRGHLSFLRSASLGCDALIVGLQLSPMDCKLVYVQHSFCQRLRRLELLRSIDRIVPYRDVDHLVQQLHFDCLFLGEDQQHPGFCRAVEHCRSRGIPVVRFPRTPGISSTALRQGLPGRFIKAVPPAP